MVRSSSSSKLAKLGGPLTKSDDLLGLGRGDPRGDVDQHHLADQVRGDIGEGDRRQAPGDMPTTAWAAGARARIAAETSSALTRGLGWPCGPLTRPVGMAVTGQVDGHQRAAQRHGHRVPGVGVLRSAVNQDQLRIASTPDQSTQPPTGLDLDELASHLRWPDIGQAELGSILVEQPELVVLDAFDHGRRLTQHSR